MTEPQLPDAERLIEHIRQVLQADGPDAARAALDEYAPGIDALADIPTAAAWLGISASSIYRERSRHRADGAPGWPPPDAVFGRSGAWTYRTLALHRATMPGQGSAGRGRPRRRAD